MPFQIGLNVPGLTEAYLSPEPYKGLALFGKGLGSGLDRLFGLDDTSREIASRERIARMAHPDKSAQDGGTLHVDDYGNITEDLLPDSDYHGVAGSDVEKEQDGTLFGRPPSMSPEARAGLDMRGERAAPSSIDSIMFPSATQSFTTGAPSAPSAPSAYDYSGDAAGSSGPAGPVGLYAPSPRSPTDSLLGDTTEREIAAHIAAIDAAQRRVPSSFSRDKIGAQQAKAAAATKLRLSSQKSQLENYLRQHREALDPRMAGQRNASIAERRLALDEESQPVDLAAKRATTEKTTLENENERRKPAFFRSYMKRTGRTTDMAFSDPNGGPPMRMSDQPDVPNEVGMKYVESDIKQGEQESDIEFSARKAAADTAAREGVTGPIAERRRDIESRAAAEGLDAVLPGVLDKWQPGMTSENVRAVASEMARQKGDRVALRRIATDRRMDAMKEIKQAHVDFEVYNENLAYAGPKDIFADPAKVAALPKERRAAYTSALSIAQSKMAQAEDELRSLGDGPSAPGPNGASRATLSGGSAPDFDTIDAAVRKEMAGKPEREIRAEVLRRLRGG